MGAFIDKTGLRSGRLLVIERDPCGADPIKWICRCDCGSIVSIRTNHLDNDHTESCGCLQREDAAIKKTTHGLHKSKVYEVWRNMKARCGNPNNQRYKNYGSRGIAVCQRWLKFELFFEDMGHPPPGMTIERKNNDAGIVKITAYGLLLRFNTTTPRETCFSLLMAYGIRLPNGQE